MDQQRFEVLTEQQTGQQTLTVNEYKKGRRHQILDLVARFRYPPTSFDHYYPRWQGITGWLPRTQAEWLFTMAKTLDVPGDIVEIGSAYGRSATCMAWGIKLHGKGRVYAIDPHTGGINFVEKHKNELKDFSSLGFFLKNISRFNLEHFVVPLPHPSDVAATVWPDDRAIRLLFIDGWHSYEACRNDMRTWSKWVSPGGVMVIHDYAWGEGVKDAVDDTLPTLAGFGKLQFVDKNMVFAYRDAE